MIKVSPAVSIILPNYNHSFFLRKRIESILFQTYQDFELILLDDCSTDNSTEILKEYETHPRVSYLILNEVNSGSTFAQWQKGFSLATGTYIWIAESDDYADCTFLEKLVRELVQSDKNVIAFSKSNIIDAQDNLLSQDWDRVRVKDESITSHFTGKEFVIARMLFNNSIYNASMVLFKRTALKAVCPQYASLTYSGDWMFWIDICLQGNVIRYNEKLNSFRQHAQKVTPKAEAKGIRFQEGMIVLRHIFDILNLSSVQRKVIVGRFIKSLLTNKKFESRGLKKSVYQQVLKYFDAHKRFVLLYELDKRFNFSKLSIQKNRYI